MTSLDVGADLPSRILRAMLSFMFATGIENSVPTIQNGRHRVDELEKCGFYKHWRKDFDLCRNKEFGSCATVRLSTRHGSAKVITIGVFATKLWKI